MPFCWLVAVLDKRISTNIYGHFELFNFSSKIITLVAGLDALSEQPRSDLRKPIRDQADLQLVLLSGHGGGIMIIV